MTSGTGSPHRARSSARAISRSSISRKARGSRTVRRRDGYLTLAILPNRGDAAPSGINHFGFQVDDVDDLEARLAKWNEPMTERPSTRPFAEHRAMDPDGNLFDISVHGYDEVEYAADRQMKAKKEKQPA